MTAGAVDLGGALDELAAATAFSGVVRVDHGGEVVLAKAFGLADRANGIANTVATRFAIASGTKTFTALAVVRLIEDGALSLDTTARSLLGDDLPLIADDVTVEHLLAHRSGIGDYLDEEADGEITDYAMPVPVHQLDGTEAYLAVLDGFPAAFPAGTGFSYCNGGYVVLAILAQRAAGVAYTTLVDAVCERAGLVETAFLRSDELSGGVAVGYLAVDHDRTNVLHLPVLGVGDGGLTSSVADIATLWDAFLAGRIVAPAWVAEMVRLRSTTEQGSGAYGLGFWLDPSGPAAQLEGYDAGVSFRSVHDPAAGTTWTVVSNTSEGAWPIATLLAERVNENRF